MDLQEQYENARDGNLEAIRRMPTTHMVSSGPSSGTIIPQSMFRVSGILKKVKQLLRQKTPYAVILEVIEHLEQPDDQYGVTQYENDRVEAKEKP